MRNTFLFVVLIWAIAPVAGAQRLPEIATPEKYQLTIALDFDKENFTGDETIDVRVLKPTSTIVLNAAEITFAEVTVAAAGKGPVKDVQADAVRITAQASDQDASLHLFAHDETLSCG